MKKIPGILEPKWLVVGIFFFSGIFLGGLSSYLWLSAQTQGGNYKMHLAQNSYRYIDPLLGVDTINETAMYQNSALKLEVEKLISQAQGNKSIESTGVYFRDIGPGTWMGTNENTMFSPGKLLKIPLMMAYFKLAEGGPNILNNEIEFAGIATPGQELKSGSPLQNGQTYTVEELIHSMIVDHNDDAANLLFDNIDKDKLNEIFSDLGIPFKEDKMTQDFLSLKAYSLFFRILYNATYLNHEYSEKSLELLHEGDTSRGIVSTIPKGIPTATRASGRQYTEGGITKYEVYDCGIMYYPSHPYLLCAVARGANLNKLWGFLGTVGDAVYKNFSYQYPQ